MQNKMRPQSLCAVRRFTPVYLHTQTAIDAFDICTQQTMVILNTGKPNNPQFEAHAGIRIAQILGSPVYICVW